MFFNVCLHSRPFPLRADWGNLTAQSTGSHRGIEGAIQIYLFIYTFCYIEQILEKEKEKNTKIAIYMAGRATVIVQH